MAAISIVFCASWNCVKTKNNMYWATCFANVAIKMENQSFIHKHDITRARLIQNGGSQEER